MKPYLAIPNRDGRLDRRHFQLIQAIGQQFPGTIMDTSFSSLLCYNFNTMYAKALNARANGVTHFVLLHDDVVPLKSDWLHILKAEADKYALHAISAVVTIKGTDRISNAKLVGQVCETLTLDEFGRDTTLVGDRHVQILINTGCLLMDITKPWADEFCFTTGDVIRKVNGVYEAHCESEDYRMSKWMADRGIPYGATSKVPNIHVGRCDYQTK